MRWPRIALYASFLIFLIFIMSCNRRLTPAKTVSIDAAFQVYVNDFISEGQVQGRAIVIDNLLVHFAQKLSGETIGECFLGDTINPTILIDSGSWANGSETYRKVLMFHELSHCVLLRPHIFTMNGPGGIPTSLMYPTMYDDDNLYINNWAYYMKELFNPGGS